MLQFFLRYFGSFLVSISTVALLFVLYSLGIFSDVNRSWTDNLYDSGDSSANIVIVGIDSKSMDELGRWPRPRSEFAKLVNQLSQAEAVGINVSFFDQFDIDGSQQFAVALRSSNNVVLRSIVSEFGSVDGQEGLVIKDETFPVELLQENARAVGYTNVFFDDDGVCRKFFVNLKGRSKSFAEEIYKLYLNRDFSHAESSLFIDYKGGSGGYEIYSFVDVVNGKFKKDFWENKIVLVGSTTPEIHDIYNVPTAKNSGMYGVEVQANIIQTLISRNFLKVQNDLSLFWIMLGGAMVTGLLVLTFRLKTSTALSLLLIGLYIFASVQIFYIYKIIPNLIYFPLTIIFSYLFNISLVYAYERAENKKIVRAFGKYVDPKVVDEIRRKPKKLKLGGKRKTVTVLFSDIRNFTNISENLTPEQVVNLLNIYLEDMSNIVVSKEGYIDKYIGDAIMAFWNSDHTAKQGAILGCTAAIEMRDKLILTMKKLNKASLPSFDIGIGLNTDSAIVGNVGSNKRYNYTIIGDSVNLASRIEGLTKDYGVKILISQSTYEMVKEHFLTKKVDLVRVKGKDRSVWIYELICVRSEGHKQVPTKIEKYKRSIEDLLHNDWKDF